MQMKICKGKTDTLWKINSEIKAYEQLNTGKKWLGL